MRQGANCLCSSSKPQIHWAGRALPAHSAHQLELGPLPQPTPASTPSTLHPLPHPPPTYVYQAVHQLFEGTPDREWLPGEARTSRMVFIGRDLDGQAFREAL